jgi:putative hydrolase of the HAD superfamily
MVRGLILDFGGVLTWPQRAEWLEAMAQKLGVAAAAMHAAYAEHRRPYDAGLPARDYWARVLDTLGRSALAAAIPELIELDIASWTEYRDEVWSLARAFRDRGGRTAFLSNGVPETMARIRADRPLETWFYTVVVSYEVGLSKPDPAIYRLCLSRMGLSAAEALFVDDRAENVEAAARLGIRTLQFAGDDALPRLGELVGLA